MNASSSNDKYVPALAYAPLTRFYDLIVALTTRERTFKQALITLASIEPNTAVLDLACGTGTLALRLKTQHPGAHITGIDGDSSILRIARAKALKAGIEITLDRGLSFALPYRDHQFDTVVSSLFFHHLNREKKRQSAAEIYRVLKPGGRVYIADWGKPDNKLMGLLYYAIQLLDGLSNTQDNREGLLPTIFREAGFDPVRQHRTFSTVFGTMALFSGAKCK